MHNEGNYVISLGNVVRWMAQQAESLGVEIFPGFAAAEVLYDDSGSVKGVATGNLGVGKDGEPTENFQLGMELHAKYTIFAEGARGHLGKTAHREVQAGRRPRPAKLGHRRQGALGDRPCEGQARTRRAHGRLADGWRHLRRRLSLPPRRPQGDARLRARPRLQEPVDQPLRGDAALEDSPEHPPAPRRRQTAELWRARDQQRHAAMPAQDRVPGRRIDRLRCGLHERSAHQGQPCGDQDRHAGRRSRVRGGGGRAPARRADGLS